jgi:hypothetical protein
MAEDVVTQPEIDRLDDIDDKVTWSTSRRRK